MVAGIGRRIPLVTGMAAVAAAGLVAASPPPSTPRRRVLPHKEPNAHVWDWERHQSRLAREQERLEALERDRRWIEAADTKRARKNAKRARLVST